MEKYLYQMEPGFTEEDVREVVDCIQSTWVLEGPRTRAFEQAIAGYTGARFAAAVPSCTVALALSLMALGVGAGDEVLIPDLTFVATANAVNLTGASPVFVDIQPDSLGMNPDCLEQAITPQSRAVIPVWYNGRDPHISTICEIADKNHLPVVEDAACALGSFHHKKHSGTFGDLGCFSFNTTKIITTSTGGMVITDSAELYEKVVRLKNHGRIDRQDYHPSIGFNFSFSDLLAALGLAQMRQLEKRVSWKRNLYREYYDQLHELPGIKMLPPLEEECLWYPDLFMDNPRLLKDFLQDCGIQTRLYFPPIHTQPCYPLVGNFPVSESISRHGIWLPTPFSLTEADLQQVCLQIKSCLERRKPFIPGNLKPDSG